MTNEVPSWGLPDPFNEHILKLNEIGLWLLRRGFYSDAQSVHEVRYDLIFDRQHLVNRRLHKGSPLFEIAICAIAKGEHIPAIQSLLAAFVEDTLSDMDLYSDELLLPSWSILTDMRGYGIDEELLVKLAAITVAAPDKNDPRRIIEDFLKERKIDNVKLNSIIRNKPSFAFNKYAPEDIPGLKEKRVFVGGSHSNYIVIGLIENILIELNYQPIIPNQFTQRENVSDREHCFALLKNCAKAVFEISVPNGWQVEVENANSNNIPLLCLHQGDKPSRSVSSMLKAYPNAGWKTYDDLKQTIKRFCLSPSQGSSIGSQQT